jgi:hypothetical protein
MGESEDGGFWLTLILTVLGQECSQPHDQRRGPLFDKRRSMIPLCPLQSDRVCRTSRAAEERREGEQSRGVRQPIVFRDGTEKAEQAGADTPLRRNSEVTIDPQPHAPGAPPACPQVRSHLVPRSSLLSLFQ